MGPFDRRLVERTAADYDTGYDEFGFSISKSNPKKSFDKSGSGTERSFDKFGSGINLVPRDVNPNAVAKTAISAGTALGALGFINKANKQKQGRTMKMMTPIQTTVAPEQDLPAEVLAQRQNQIGRLRSTYRGSDPSMKLISDLTASTNRVGQREQLASERGRNLIEERKRVAAENAANQLRAGETQHENIRRQQELDDYKLGAEIDRTNQLNKLLGQVGSTAIDNIETGEAMSIRGDQVDRENALASIDTDIQQKNNEIEKKIAMEGYSIPEINALYNEINNLVAQRNAIQTTGTPRLFTRPGINKYRSSIYKNGGKLIPR